jgi:hypothetical protein
MHVGRHQHDSFVCVCVRVRVRVCVPKNLLLCSQSKNLLPNDFAFFTTFLPYILFPKNLLTYSQPSQLHF